MTQIKFLNSNPVKRVGGTAFYFGLATDATCGPLEVSSRTTGTLINPDAQGDDPYLANALRQVRSMQQAGHTMKRIKH